MRKVMLAGCIAAGLSGACVQSMDISGMRPRDIIIAGVVAGLSIQLTKWTIEHERYKQIWPFIKDYPGFAIAGGSAIVGLLLMYGRPLMTLFHGSPAVSK